MSIAEPPTTEVATASERLQHLQRQRAWFIKSRIMVANRLQATVAGTIGYSAGMPEKERLAVFRQAAETIKKIVAGEVESDVGILVLTTMPAINAYEVQTKAIDKLMLQAVKTLPIVDWVEMPDQRGFGLQMLSILIGETGDLNNYVNPAKVWRRMGCAPYTHDDKSMMGKTWRSGTKGKLPAAEWEKFGYSPRRRSIAYLIGEGLLKQNGHGPYRKRYLEAKVNAYKRHPETTKDWNWRECDKCGTTDAVVCQTCGGIGVTCGHAHNHGMLLMTKRLMFNLWMTWTGAEFVPWED